jgi:hypothetical protein
MPGTHGRFLTMSIAQNAPTRTTIPISDPKRKKLLDNVQQTFPNVRLLSRSGGTVSVVLGIELKGWYLLAKEGVPSFRYTVTPAACSEYDLLVVIPWHLKNVLSGVPIVLLWLPRSSVGASCDAPASRRPSAPSHARALQRASATRREQPMRGP